MIYFFSMCSYDPMSIYFYSPPALPPYGGHQPSRKIRLLIRETSKLHPNTDALSQDTIICDYIESVMLNSPFSEVLQEYFLFVYSYHCIHWSPILFWTCHSYHSNIQRVYCKPGKAGQNHGKHH